jgi:Bacteriocin-protection, YdeI or OmpD-Associated/Domain of unknown function (DUF1905)
MVAASGHRGYGATMNGDPPGLRRFRVPAMARPRGGISVAIPFDPAVAWGERDQYHVHGTVGGNPVRGPLSEVDGGWSLQLGPSWCRNPGFDPGDEVEVLLGPEGSQSTTLGADVAAAFAAEPAAARFFDSLPSFYRNDYARWIEGAKRPETRARRIADLVELTKQGKRER